MPNLAEDLSTDFQNNLYYEPDCPPPPGTLLAESDEFGGNTIASKWQTWNPGANMTISQGSGMGNVQMAATAAASCGGIFQPLPTGLAAFTFAAKLTCAMRWAAASTVRYGLMLAQDTLVSAPTTADIRSCGMSNINASTGGVVAGVLTAYNAAYTEDVLITRRDMSIYVRGRVTGIGTAPAIAWDWCDDGTGWSVIDPARAVGFTPGFFGICVRNNNANTDPAIVRCEWFRVVSGDVGFASLSPGGRLIPFT